MNDSAVTSVLVHFADFALEFDDVWDATDTPLFVHCHGYDVTWDLHRYENPGRAWFPDDYRARVRGLAERATLIANSQFTARVLTEAGVRRDRVVVKYLGVPIVTPPPTRSTGDTQLEILYLGRLVDAKGPDLLVRAFTSATSMGLDAHLTIAGDGPMRCELERLIAHSGVPDRITMLGWVDEAQGDALRRQADVFTAHNRRGVRTHQEEAFGVSVAEAMACGLPVVTGRSGALPELVVHRKTGLLFEPGDVSAHAEALLTLAHDPQRRLQMGQEAWRRAKELLSVDTERRRLLEILGLSSMPS